LIKSCITTFTFIFLYFLLFVFLILIFLAIFLYKMLYHIGKEDDTMTLMQLFIKRSTHKSQRYSETIIIFTQVSYSKLPGTHSVC
jgi:hypothetical protein